MDNQNTIALRSAICCSPTGSDNVENSDGNKQHIVSPQILDGQENISITEDKHGSMCYDKENMNREIELLANWKEGENENEASCDVQKEDDLQLRLGITDDFSKLDATYTSSKEAPFKKAEADQVQAHSFDDQTISVDEQTIKWDHVEGNAKKYNNEEKERYMDNEIISNRWNFESTDASEERWKLADPKEQGSNIECLMDPQLYTIYKATVLSTQSSGVLVRLHGFRHQALVPLSHMDECEVLHMTTLGQLFHLAWTQVCKYCPCFLQNDANHLKSSYPNDAE